MVLAGATFLPKCVIQFGGKGQFAKEVAEGGFIEHNLFRWLSGQQCFPLPCRNQNVPKCFCHRNSFAAYWFRYAFWLLNRQVNLAFRFSTPGAAEWGPDEPQAIVCRAHRKYPR